MSKDDGIGDEQAHLTVLYGRLDALRAETRERLDHVLAATGLTHQGLAERDASAAELADRAARLDAVENGLCFGRIDTRDGARHRIGRIGLPGTDSEPLLIDWRADAARPFYTATAVSPEGVALRRHITTRDRRVTGVSDERLDGTAAGLAGDAALLEALRAARTDRMHDIVPTIQAEQDAVIRADPRGVLVVQGGPGTGKTAVALHRTAYLLHTRRERLAKSVVLLIGPSPAFLRYIGDVLPALGETGVRMTTVDRLLPGVRATGTEPPAAAEVKGRLAMAGVIAAAVAERQRVPGADEPMAVPFDGGEPIPLDRETCLAARAQARDTRLAHNEARPVFHDLVTDALARRYAARFATDVLDGSSLLTDADLAVIRDDLRADPGVRAAIDTLWPPLSPGRLLTELYASPRLLAAAAPDLDPAERGLLLRGPHRPWTPADIPLLDEAAELLGSDDTATRAAAGARRAERVALAQEALDIARGSRRTDFDDGAAPEFLSAYDLLDAERLADRQAATDHRTPAERAAADRRWTYGHVVVDEAQELSAMAWRMLMRRCPARSMTIVGDIAQTGDPAGAPSWDRVLRPHCGDRWRLAELTVNYRLPAEIADVSAQVLRRIDPDRTAPRAVRSEGVPPWSAAVAPDGLDASVARLAARESRAVAGGTVAVVAPAARVAGLTAAVSAHAPGVPVLDARQAKGLEYDAVLVVDPEGIAAASPRGLNDLYVALTRATRRLGVVHPGTGTGAPAGLAGLRPLRGGA
ncbi:AAA family ATPase [Streptomyces sp. RFCAC02]|uniref:AAA family ATPase n=1 Tax=Streptomyces sp. RFCAC02 TaxID=2499143 RepID=UPI0010229F4A|nr:AAA family ATPase [Streptomyces sp. RFCAC02]